MRAAHAQWAKTVAAGKRVKLPADRYGMDKLTREYADIYNRLASDERHEALRALLGRGADKYYEGNGFKRRRAPPHEEHDRDVRARAGP